MSAATDPPEARPPGPPPRDSSHVIIVRAVKWATERDIRVLATASPGVRCTSQHPPVWEVDPHFDGVSPLGAAILHQQPPCADLETAEWLAVGESARWAEGFSIGIAGLRAQRSWALHPAGPMITRGYLEGLSIYNVAVSVVCPQHPGTRHPRDEQCLLCLEANVTPIDPNAGRH